MEDPCVLHRPGITRDPEMLPIAVILRLHRKYWGIAYRAGHTFQMGVEYFS